VSNCHSGFFRKRSSKTGYGRNKLKKQKMGTHLQFMEIRLGEIFLFLITGIME